MIVPIIVVLVIVLTYAYVSNIGEIEQAKINNFLKDYCDDPAILNPKEFTWTQDFRNNWKKIRDEFIQYSNTYNIPHCKSISPKHALYNKDWKTVFLRSFGVDLNIINLFPETMRLINSCPCTTAFFSVLEPGARLPPHEGMYKGVIRYHLGLIIPDDWEQCFINVDGTTLYWTEGDDIMFDDMYTHYVENNTNQRRVILFLDIKRDFNNPLINLANSTLLHFIKSNDMVTNAVSNANAVSKNVI